jgi:DNA-binding transcriptional LysR family regulator
MGWTGRAPAPIGFRWGLRSTRSTSLCPIRQPLQSLVVAVTILNEPVIVALRKNHPLAAQSAIPVAALANEPFITTHLKEGIGFYDHMMSVCRQGGFTPRVVQRAPQLATIVSLVGAGLGVALVPGGMPCLFLSKPPIITR